MKKLLTAAALLLAASASQAVLLAHFKLDESGGNAVDSSANAYTTTAVATGSGMGYGQASVTAGTYGALTVSAARAAAFGTSVDFGIGSRNNGHFELHGAAANAINGLIEPGTGGHLINGAMTVMAWVNLAGDVVTAQTIFSSGSNVNGWKLGTANGGLKFTLIGRQDITSNFNLLANQWNHLALTAQDGTFKFYLNGNLMATKPALAFIVDENATALARLGFGAGAANEPMFGRMDEVKIFNTALDANAIAAAALPELPASPVPEPGTPLMSAVGLLFLGALARGRHGAGAARSA